MEPFPHHYRVESAYQRDGATVALKADGLPALETAPPKEFGGTGTHWSPETLLVAAVADCFILSFKAIAEASKFEWKRIEVQVDGTLDRVERRMLFTEFAIAARLTVPAASERSAMRLLEKAEEACLITNSLSADIKFNGDVTVDG